MPKGESISPKQKDRTTTNFKNVVFQIDYDKCKSLVLKYIYYPQEDGGFIYTDRFGSYPIPVSNDIPVDGVLVIK